jgi:hypothetical protein
MQKDFNKWTVYINRSYLSNFAIGIDFYTVYENNQPYARVFQMNFLFGNITFTRWGKAYLD